MAPASTVLDAPDLDQTLYRTLQQEVDLGVRALNSGDADVAITLFQSALEKLSIEQPFYDHLVHNLLRGYKLLIEQSFAADDPEPALDVLRAALNLEIAGPMAADDDFCRKFGGGFHDLGVTFFKHHHFDASVACCRKAMNVYPSPGSYVNLTNALAASGRRAILADFTNDLTREQLGRHIFIACVPKSASTFLKNILLSLTGYRDAFMVYAAGQTEHDLYLPTLREVAHMDTVTQQHCRAADATVQMMQGFEIRPVVLIRNIYDSVISLLDFYNKGAASTSFSREDFQSLDERTQIDLLIDNVIPWYFQFVSSWSLVEKQKRLEILWLSYEELTINKTASLQKVLSFYGLGASGRSIEQKVNAAETDKTSIRFNKGVAGRGESILTTDQKQRIQRLSKYYPSTDFAGIGL